MSIGMNAAAKSKLANIIATHASALDTDSPTNVATPDIMGDLGFSESDVSEALPSLQAAAPEAAASAAGTSGSEAAVKSAVGHAGVTSSVEERALQLLGSGITAEATANALGVTPSRISQLLSTQEFSNKVATIRYKNLQKHNQRDGEYDTLEDELIKKLKTSMPFMLKPTEILRAITVINGAKRRGQSAPDQTINQQNIVNLVLPQVIAERFTVNVDNQVTRAGDQELHTMSAGTLLKDVEEKQKLITDAQAVLSQPVQEGTS